MQAIEILQSTLGKLAAKVVGRADEVRVVRGRQLAFFHKPNEIFVLPYIKSDPLQDHDPLSPTYGKFYFMVDFDDVDGSPIL